MAVEGDLKGERESEITAAPDKAFKANIVRKQTETHSKCRLWKCSDEALERI
jgi:hypothetical protein